MLGDGGALLEREAELAVLVGGLRAAFSGLGSVFLIEGPPGIGKTSLLGEACRRAESHGMTVLSASGDVLERDFGFGVARQLFEPLMHRADPEERDQLLVGAAALATPVVAPDRDYVAAPDQNSVVHGLYWLTSNLAERAPLVIAVDDVQWSDSATLVFLAYLARRVGEMRVMMLGALRGGDTAVHPTLVAELTARPVTKIISPGPLSSESVGHLVRSRLGGDADETFIEACRAVSGGVPFLLEELLGLLRSDGVEPTAKAAVRVTQASPRTVAHATMLRLSRFSRDAAAVAQALSVLGRHGRLDRIATLAGVDPVSARGAIDALVAMDVVAPGQPLRFAHPLVQQAIYEDLQPATRAHLHHRVAQILAEQGAAAGETAAHLLLSEPMGRKDVVETLRAAAGEELTRGAPESAVAYLRRALAEEAAGIDRFALLHELGTAEALAGDAGAVVHLTEAIAVAHDPTVRAEVVHELATVHALSGEWARFSSLVRDALAEPEELDSSVTALLETARGAAEFFNPESAHLFEVRLPRLLELIDRGDPAGRGLALLLAAVMAARGMDRAKVLELVERGLDDGRSLNEMGSHSPVLAHAPGALIALDELDAAAHLVGDMLDDARRRGSGVGYATASIYGAWIEAQRGRLGEAEVILRTAVDISVEHGLSFWLPTVFEVGADVLLERPQVEDLAALVLSMVPPAGLDATFSGALVLAVRGRLRLARGQRDAAIEDLRRAGEIAKGAQIHNPIWVLWRSPLALALAPEARDDARALVSEELDWASKAGLDRCKGVAMRTLGCLEAGHRAIELFEESLDVLVKCDAPLERARTAVELGAALRRTNQRRVGRPHLEAGLELAHRCGAEHLAARAESELRAAGARPRRRAVTGPDALTASEARVARMAADGMANREIAQHLFVTAKTVENQLGSAYSKLGVRSRRELRTALGEPESAT